MKQYEEGKFYNFWVTGVGYGYINLKDEEGSHFCVKAYDFQLDWDWASDQVPVEILSCYVMEAKKGSDYVYLHQNREFLLRALYREVDEGGIEEGIFVIRDLKSINGELYYVVSDVYGVTHMYKPMAGDDTNLQPGDEITLWGTEIVVRNENRTFLRLTSNVVPVNLPLQVDLEGDDNDTPGYYGEEDDTKEFKSTIVYPAGATGPDIDTQIQIIVRTLAGFMNANGGTLFIGVDDNGNPVGIEREYRLLNTSENDNKKVYQENKDGYQNKIRSAINFYLGQVACDYVKITFENNNGHVVCRIDVESSANVIWFRGESAFKRMGNRTAHLRGESIVKLVYDKSGYSRPVVDVKPEEIDSEDNVIREAEIKEEQSLPQVAAERKSDASAKKLALGMQREGRGSFYMNIFANGEWSWSKVVPSDSDLEFCVPINAPASKNDLVMVYADGCVNRVDAYHLHLNRNNEGHRYANGKRPDGVQLLKVFTAREDDLLACFSKQNGHPFVKVHELSHISRRDGMRHMGNRVINVAGMDGVAMEDICFVASEHAHRVSSLMKTENQKSSSLGFQMDLAKHAKLKHVVDTLRLLCDNEAHLPAVDSSYI